VLITGGTGSFGNAMCRRLLDTEVAEIRIFSRDEKKQDDMRRLYSNPRLSFYIGDVRNVQSVKEAMSGVDYVFHAAALKQVPSCEFYPMEAIATNAAGADNVMTSAIDSGVNTVVVLSTDKAVYPINAMGISKAMMEKIMIAKSRIGASKNCILCGTRYGNVMASRGSVIPLFIEQIKAGVPLTVTDGSMTRFIMSLEEAIDLAIFAFDNAKPGDIFVHKAPATTIDILAAALKSIFHVDNPIKVIGVRHGEKHYETLLNREEMVRAEDMGRYYRVESDTRGLNYDLYFSDGRLDWSQYQEFNSENTRLLSLEEVIDILLNLDYVQDKLKDWNR